MRATVGFYRLPLVSHRDRRFTPAATDVGFLDENPVVGVVCELL
jgi:hypothetical protein